MALFYVVTLEDIQPPARYTSSPWTAVRLDEGPTSTGPWTALDTFVLDPLDADPANPAARSVTSSRATLEAGWYRPVMLDADGAEFPLVAVRNARTDAALDRDYVPAVQDVADLLRARTKDRATGDELGTFSTATRPTDEQVRNLIDRAVRTTGLRIGRVPDDAVAPARQVAALHAALLIELSYFPEQVATDRSPYAELKALHDEQVRSLSDVGTGGGDPGGPGGRRSGVRSVPVGTLVAGDYLVELEPLA